MSFGNAVLLVLSKFEGVISCILWGEIKSVVVVVVPQATEPRTPYLFDPNFHLLRIHPSFLLGRNYDAMFVVDLRNSFPLEDYHWLKF